MSLTIGFGGTFYTLWRVTPYERWDTSGDFPRKYLAVAYQYLRNLSIDLDRAKAKLKETIGDEVFDVDLTLHGEKWFERITYYDAEPPKDYTFTFGRLKGEDIREAGKWIAKRRQEFDEEIETSRVVIRNNESKAEAHRPSAEYMAALREGVENRIRTQDAVDARDMKDVVWQLERAMRDESTARRKVYARRRLIELGELVRRDWIQKIPVYTENADESTAIAYCEKKVKWMPKGLAKWFTEIGDKKGLFYTDKARVDLTIKELRHKLVDTAYGTMWIVTYADAEGRILTYKGSAYPGNHDNHPFEVKATIKHNRGETFLQRIKVTREYA